MIQVDPSKLTARERQVAQLLATSMPLPEVSVAVGLTMHSVRTYAKRILKKLGLNARLQLVEIGSGAFAEIAAATANTNITPHLRAQLLEDIASFEADADIMCGCMPPPVRKRLVDGAQVDDLRAEVRARAERLRAAVR